MTTAIDTTTGDRTGSAGWYGELAPSEKRTFWACFGGWALDAFDVQIFSFAIPAIVATFSITNADAGLIGTVTLLTSALGGWFAGMLADRFGRAERCRSPSCGSRFSRSCAVLPRLTSNCSSREPSWAWASAANGRQAPC